MKEVGDSVSKSSLISPSSKDLENDGNKQLKIQHRKLSWLFSKSVPPLPLPEERTEYPAKSANIISKIFFWWLFPILKKGYKRTLEQEDMFLLTPEIEVTEMTERFEVIFYRLLAEERIKFIKAICEEDGLNYDEVKDDPVKCSQILVDFEAPGLLGPKSMFLTFKGQYLLSMILCAIGNSSITVAPLLSKKLITFVELKQLGLAPSAGKGVGYALGTSLLTLVGGLFFNHYFYRAMFTGASAKGVLAKAILDKAFKSDAKARAQFTSSKLTSLMGTDINRIDFAFTFQPFMLTFPIPFAICIVILIINIGAISLVGVGLVFILLILFGVLGAVMMGYRRKATKFTDSRVDSIKEVLTNLKIIKFYSWEGAYHKLISTIRKREMVNIFKMQVIRDLITALAFGMPILVSCVTFLSLYGVDKEKRSNPAAIFSSVSLINILASQVIMIPIALATGADAWISLRRVSNFLASSELNFNERDYSVRGGKLKEMEKQGLAIEVKNASFEWEQFPDYEDDPKKKKKEGEEKKKLKKEIKQEKKKKEEEKKRLRQERYLGNDITTKSPTETTKNTRFPGLKNLDFNVRKGEFIVVTGLIGSGKSSLLHALSGVMKKIDGSVNVNGDLLGYGSPWVQSATFRENVTFGTPYEEKKYKDIIYACSLESDLDLLSAGDRTEIGERGVTLSGGQKARLNLARAVYADSDIILLDDVLSAVDARVGKHIMDNCILGLLKDKTRILATHQLSLIGAADRIVFLNGDGTISVGLFDELSSQNKGFKNLMQYSTETKKKSEIGGQAVATIIEVRDYSDDDEDFNNDYKKADDTLPDFDDGKLYEDESRAVNRVQFDVLKDYVKCGSKSFTVPGYLLIMFFFITLATFSQLFTNVWLTYWVELKFDRPPGFYIGIYIMLTFVSLFLLFVEFILIVYITNKASVVLNILAVKNVLHTPMSYIDTTPMGRIMNRFTKDTDVLDNELGTLVRMVIFGFASIIGILILCIIYVPWFGIAIPFLGLMFYVIVDFYQASNREVKRLEAVNRSFVYSNFSESLNGIDTIRAYNRKPDFLERNRQFINTMNEAYYVVVANQRWLGISLDVLGFFILLIVSLLCVFRVFSVGAASTGLLMSYLLQIMGQLSFSVSTYTQVENEMNSVERMREYAYALPKEAVYEKLELKPSSDWPQKAEITFDNVNLRYRDDLPLVLKNLSFKVGLGEKVGICGRTGAGKSSIMVSLFRIVELESGTISIDGIDLAQLGLHDVRSTLSIIPQDPVLFRGNIRKNLDAFGQYSDEVLWDALRRTGLIDSSRLEEVKLQVVSSDGDDSSLDKFHLDKSVEDDGANFSLGERQLITFARALVRNSKILILDEATSSVDYETDAKIQETIRSEFSHCTILCIAHRLKTIINYDKIMVMDKGTCVEFDTPWNLFNTNGSIFQQMCERSHLVANDFKHD
ncbi:uncharacterized protein KQ657_000690 [Scheffersomyces spartinae]|uniref:Oligomycin resistance ATP-dependent permease YOR1 n=1 Tax=Scheffersomyces spartinae TaxID=45513 RepID=A0A9P8AHQ6_9ASCO|nr:uncharacterized protein KQ657_000690 [Scheffersomyces spartinae]KAG7193617.1 hypothetical protein KQ657_000690 [Scheffersomyces spartinae]